MAERRIRAPIRIAHELIAYFFVASIVPLAILGWFAYETVSGTIFSISEEYTLHEVRAQAEYVQHLIGELSSVSQNIAGVEEITSSIARMDEAGTSDNRYTILSTQAKIGYILSGYSQLEGLVSIDLFTTKGGHVHVGDTLAGDEVDIRERDRLFRLTNESASGFSINGVGPNLNLASSASHVLTVSRSLRGFVRGSPAPVTLGLLVLSYSTDQLSHHFTGVSAGAGAYLLLIDASGRLVFHPKSNQIGAPVLPQFRGLLTGIAATHMAVLNSERVMIAVRQVAGIDWYVVSVVPRASLMAPMERLVQLGLALGIVCLLLVLVVVMMFSHNIIAPLRAVTDGFRKLRETQDAQVPPLREVPRSSEIAELVHGYNDYLTSLHERNRKDMELQRYRDDLENMVKEQTTAALLARDEAQAANKTKSEFLSNISHELRTPMHAILSFAELSSRRLGAHGDIKLIQYTSRIKSSGVRLLNLINALLDLAKLESGKMHLNLVRQSLHPIIHEALAELEPLLAEKSLQLLGPADNAVVACICDADAIGQVVRNIVGNAIKFSPENGRIEVCLGVDVSPQATGGPDRLERTIRLTVSDEGIGIPPGEHELIFESFVQSSSKNSGGGGTGLGLAISREIVKAHGGTIHAEDRPGGGTCLVVRLPLSVAAVLPEPNLIVA